MDDNKSPKLWLSMIAGDFEEVKMVERAIDYLFPYIDGVYVTITHKTKKPKKNSPLQKLIETKYKGHVSHFKWVDEFDTARNFSMDQAPKGKNQYVIWTDVDDVWMKAELIPDVFEQMVLTDLKAVYFPYWYQVELDENGDVQEIITEQKRERIIVNDGSFKWVAPLHETLIDQKQENSRKVLLKEPIVVHLTSDSRMDANIRRNLRILKQTHEKQKGKDPRTSMYLAKTYFDMAKSDYNSDKESFQENADLALEYFKLYLEGYGNPGDSDYISPSGWSEERSTAWSYIGEIAILSNSLEAAVDAIKSAIDESEKFPNYYVDLASVYIRLGEWDKAKHYLTIGTNMPKVDTTIISTPRDFQLRAYDATSKIALHDQDFKVAKKALEKMLELLPDNESFKEKITVLNSLIVFNKACQSVVYLGKYLEKIGEADKIPHLINSISKDMQSEKFVAEMRRLFMPPRMWAQNEITIVAGPGFEEWSPDSLKTGLGGSEEAIVHMANELANLGWRVTVYANPGSNAGDFNGVEYRMWYEFNPNDNFNVLVLWRGIGFVDVKPKSKFTILWMHDVPSNPDFTVERLESIDRIVVLSDFHKSLFKMNDNGVFKDIPEGKFWISSNGIVQLTPTGKTRPHNLIYASSPDRGLEYILDNWEKIKTAVPDVTLDVYYGFDVFNAIHKHNPERQIWKNKMLKKLEQDGISYHGRIGHEELHEKYSEADIWLYPTMFEEISCISAMKAQALGAIPFTTDYAALSETVKNGIKVDVDITDPDGREEFFDELIKFIKDDKARAKMRQPMMDFAQNYFLWSKVAESWSNIFNMEVK